MISVGASGEYYSFEEGPREEMPSIVVFNIEPEKSPIKILQLIYRYDDWIFKGDLFWLPVKISAEYVLEWRDEKKQLHQVWEFQGFKPEEKE